MSSKLSSQGTMEVKSFEQKIEELKKDTESSKERLMAPDEGQGPSGSSSGRPKIV